MADIRAIERAPGDQFVGPVIDDFGVPLNLRSSRAFFNPMSCCVARHLDGFNVAHHPREILHITPKSIEVFGGTVDDNALLDAKGTTTRTLTEALRTEKVHDGYAENSCGCSRNPALFGMG